MSDLSDSLTFIKREWANCMFFLTRTKNILKKLNLVKKCWVNRLFFVSKRANDRFAKKMSNSLIYHELPELNTPGLSFVMSDLSDLLTVAHLSWMIWVNRSQLLIWSEQMREWAMREWANSLPCFHSSIFPSCSSFQKSNESQLLLLLFITEWFSLFKSGLCYFSKRKLKTGLTNLDHTF